MHSKRFRLSPLARLQFFEYISDSQGNLHVIYTVIQLVKNFLR